MTDLAAPSARVIDTGEPEISTLWTPELVRVALLEHETGSFELSSQLADWLRRDDRVFTSLDSRVLGVLGLPFAIDESDETTTKALKKASQKLARQIKGWWYRCVPEATLADLQNWAILSGFAVGELAWSRDASDGLIYPKLHVHHLQHVSSNPREKRLELRTISGMIPITPGDGRWVLFAPSGAARPWMSGAIRPLSLPALLRQLTRRDWAQRSEVEGTGIRKAKSPSGAAFDKARAAFVAAIKKMGPRSILDLQGDFDFMIQLVDGNAVTGFEKLGAHCDTAITLTILGQNLTTQIEGGSHAAAGVHARVFRDRIESDVAMLSTVARDQILLPWCRYNIPGFDRAILPWPSWDATPPEDAQKSAQALLTLSQALAGLRAEGIDITPILERFELERTDDPAKDPANAPTEPKAPAPAGDPGEGAMLRRDRPARATYRRRR